MISWTRLLSHHTSTLSDDKIWTHSSADSRPRADDFQEVCCVMCCLMLKSSLSTFCLLFISPENLYRTKPRLHDEESFSWWWRPHKPAAKCRKQTGCRRGSTLQISVVVKPRALKPDFHSLYKYRHTLNHLSASTVLQALLFTLQDSGKKRGVVVSLFEFSDLLTQDYLSNLSVNSHLQSQSSSNIRE